MGERFVRRATFFCERYCDGSFPHHLIKTALTINKERKRKKIKDSEQKKELKEKEGEKVKKEKGKEKTQQRERK